MPADSAGGFSVSSPDYAQLDEAHEPIGLDCCAQGTRRFTLTISIIQPPSYSINVQKILSQSYSTDPSVQVAPSRTEL